MELWHKYQGIHLRAGENTYQRLKNLCAAPGNAIAEQFKPEMFADYRAKRLNEGISASNLNREHSYLRAVFNELERLGHLNIKNPLAKVRQLNIAERELSFLSIEQIRMLLNFLRGEALLIAKIFLAIGSRWSEAERLRVSQVRNGQIQFTGTKSGKNRSVPVDDSLIAELHEHLRSRYGADSAIAERFFMYG